MQEPNGKTDPRRPAEPATAGVVDGDAAFALGVVRREAGAAAHAPATIHPHPARVLHMRSTLALPRCNEKGAKIPVRGAREGDMRPGARV